MNHGARRTDDRRVISGIVHVLKTGCRRQDCPSLYGPPTTIYNRFRRRTMRGIWRRLFAALARVDPGDGASHRQHDGQSAPFRGGRKRGAEAQAIGPRYDKLAAHFAAAVALAAAILWWT
jgi:transposase